MKNATMPRLSDFAPAGGQLTSMEDIQDRDLTLQRAEPTDTQFGPGYRMWLTDGEGSDPMEVLSSAVVVVKQLDKMIEKKGTIPCTVCFTKQGRCWVIL